MMTTAAAALNAPSIPSSANYATPQPVADPSVQPLNTSSTVVSIKTEVEAPFDAIRRLFDHLRAHPDDAAALNATYPKRGIFKTAAVQNSTADQKFTIDLSALRTGCIPPSLRDDLSAVGLDEVLSFFGQTSSMYVDKILSTMSELAGVNLHQAHQSGNMNYRLCDYNTDTADPQSDNGCGAHTDYGTFSIIFQDGTPGLEMEDPEQPGVWAPVPGDSTIVLAGWCAVILTGGCVKATRHRVRRTPGVRRLSAVLFVAPDLNVKLRPLDSTKIVRPFSDEIMGGKVEVGLFKEVVGRKWRRREGNEKGGSRDEATQDRDIEALVWK